MKKCFLFGAVLLAWSACASWYWPFGSDDDESAEEADAPRLSELMEPASMLIDEASDLAADGKTPQAVEKYRKALSELEKVEQKYPERVKKPEFATLRNKRAYVNAAIDSLLLGQVKDNARRVAISDTTELEKRWKEEKEGKKVKDDGTKKDNKEKKTESKKSEAIVTEVKKPEQPKTGPRKISSRAQAMKDIASGDYAAAELVVNSILQTDPNDVKGLNLKAALEAARGNLNAAEEALDRAIMTHPRNHFAYYNMASLYLQKDPPDKTGAKRYYESGRLFGGPANPELEKELK